MKHQPKNNKSVKGDLKFTTEELNDLNTLFALDIQTSQDFKKFLQDHKKDLDLLSSDKNKIKEMTNEDLIRLLSILSPIMQYYVKFYGFTVDRLKQINNKEELKWLAIFKEMYLTFTPIVKNLDHLGPKFNALLSHNNTLRTISIASMLNSYFLNQTMNPNPNGPDFISLAKDGEGNWLNTNTTPIWIKDLNAWFTRLNSVLLNKSSIEGLLNISSSKAPLVLLKNIEYKLRKESSYTLNSIITNKINVSDNNHNEFNDLKRWDGLAICFWGFDENNSYRCFITKHNDTLNVIKDHLKIKKDLSFISKNFIAQQLGMTSKIISNPIKRKDAQCFTLMDAMTQIWDYRVINQGVYFKTDWKQYDLRLWEILSRLYNIDDDFIRYAVLEYLIKTYTSYEMSFASIESQYQNKLKRLKAKNESTQELEEKFNKFKTEWDELTKQFFNSYVDERLITSDDVKDLYDDTKRDDLLDEDFKKWNRHLVFEGNLEDLEKVLQSQSISKNKSSNKDEIQEKDSNNEVYVNTPTKKIK